jgi:hypothetical protein
MTEKTKGDRISFYVFPPGQSFPWVRVYEHPFGIRGKQVEIGGGYNITKDAEPDEVALALGRMILENSEILSDWLARNDE